MKNALFILLLTAFFIVTSGIAYAQPTEKIKQTAAIYAEAMLNNDYKTIIKYTYPPMISYEGGKSAVLKQLKAQTDEMKLAGMFNTSVEIGNTSMIIKAGAQLHCIVPQIFTTKTIGGIQKRVLPLLAVSADAGRSWTFMNAIRLNAPSVSLLFHDFNHDLKVPRSSLPEFIKGQTFSDEMVAYNRSFTGKLRHYNLEFKPPPGYVASNEQLVFCGGISQHRQGTFLYSLFSEADKININIDFIGSIDTVKGITFMGRDGVKRGPNSNYIPYQTKYETFTEALTRTLYNADVSGSYDFIPCKAIPVLVPREKCKVIFIHRENQVDIAIYYYYLPENEHLLAKHLAATRNMLRFRD